MKQGIKRLEPRVVTWAIELRAEDCLHSLRIALEHAKDAGACYTVARIRSAISSAKGAVRAAAGRKARSE